MIQDRIELRVASDGYRLACRHTSPAGVPQAWLVMLHGIQSHSGWYEFTQQKLAEAGIDVRFPDRRGSGLNEVDRGHTPHWLRLVNDAVHFLNDCRTEQDRVNPGAPLILGGLSWGGRLAVAVSKLRPELMDGLILLYPGIINRMGPSTLDRLRLRLAEKLGILRRPVPLPMDDPALFTPSLKYQEFIRLDRLSVHEVTSGFLIASEHLAGLCLDQKLPAAAIPTLLMLAGRDRIVDNRQTEKLLTRQIGSQLSKVTFPEAEHSLEFDPCRDDYIQQLISWLLQQHSRS